MDDPGTRPTESAAPPGWTLAFNPAALSATFLLLVTAFFLTTVTQHNESVFGFLLNFFLMWFAAPFAWFLALRPVLSASDFTELPSPSGTAAPPVSWHSCFAALAFPLAAVTVAGWAMGRYMDGMWGADGIGPPIVASGSIALFATVWLFKRSTRPAACASFVAVMLLNAGFLWGGVVR